MGEERKEYQVTEPSEAFASWAVLEIMGHRRLGGFVRECQIAGAGMLRIDVPADGDTPAATVFYPPSSVYALTPCSEPAARAVAAANRVEPVHAWELPAAKDGPDRLRGPYFDPEIHAADDEDDEGPEL